MIDHTQQPRREQESSLKGYVAALPELAAEFERIAAAHAVNLDGTPNSLIVSFEFFLAKLHTIAFAPIPGLPIWWDPAIATHEDDTEIPLNRSQLHWVDIYHAHVGLLVQALVGGQWVSFRGARKDSRNGNAVLSLLGREERHVLSIVYGSSLRALRDPGSVPASYVADAFDREFASP